MSDLHIGPDGVTPIYAGEHALPELLKAQGHPLCLVLNGDTFDFLLDDAALELDPERAQGALHACATSAAGTPFRHALASILRQGGEVIVRPGNHDLELVLPEVQNRLHALLREDRAPTERLSFDDATQPLVLERGKLRVLVVHGEHNDPFNRWRPTDIRSSLRGETAFRYPAGSVVVKSLLNPLKPTMRFLDLLKPDFQGAMLTALAIKPFAVRQLLTPATLMILRGLLEEVSSGAAYVGDGSEELDAPALARLLQAGQFTPEEFDELTGLVDPDGAETPPFAKGSQALDKLGRAALAGYASVQRLAVGDAGAAFFDEEPEPNEWREAERLARQHNADVVVMGHTHARRWKREHGLTYINTGTWIWLMRLPQPDASIREWSDFLRQLRSDPQLEHLKCLEFVPTACLIDPVASEPVTLLGASRPGSTAS